MKNIWRAALLIVAAFIGLDACVPLGSVWAQGWDWSTWDRDREKAVRQVPEKSSAPRTLEQRLKRRGKAGQPEDGPDLRMTTLETAHEAAVQPESDGTAVPKPEPWAPLQAPGYEQPPTAIPPKKRVSASTVTPSAREAVQAVPAPVREESTPGEPAYTVPKRAATETAPPAPLPALPHTAQRQPAATAPATPTTPTVPEQWVQTAPPAPLQPFTAPAAPAVRQPESTKSTPKNAAADDAPEATSVPKYRPAVRAVPESSAPRPSPDAGEAARAESTATMLSPAGDTSVARSAVLSSPQVEHFLTVAMYDHDEQRFHRDQGLSGSPLPRVLTRWDTDLRIQVAGAATPDALRTIRQAVRTIDTALPTVSGINALLVRKTPNLYMYIFPKSPSSDIKAYSTLRHEGASIVGGEVVLYQDTLQTGVVLRELLRVLGFQGDDTVPGTLMHPDTPGDAPGLPELDRQALEILYGSRVKTGMPLDQVRAALK